MGHAIGCQFYPYICRAIKYWHSTIFGNVYYSRVDTQRQEG
jgi:hypothetical protein